MSKNQVYSLTVIFFIFLGFLATSNTNGADWWPFGKDKKSEQSKPANTAEIIVNEAPLSRDTKLTTSFSPIIKQAGPSVVTVKTTKVVELSSQGMHPFFFHFFGQPNPGGRQGTPNQPKKRKEGGLGSGVIVSKEGYILTNNHVIDGVDEIMIGLPGEDQELEAEVVGTDPRTDIAVLKLKSAKEGLPTSILGNSDHIEVGDIVLAIGTPLGLSQTVTMGIISATGRDNIGITRGGYEDFIQTDASINRGNSGGALIDAEGRVIGINTAILSQSGGNIGIGLAVPINMARSIMEQIIETGKVVRGFLGINGDSLTPELAESFGVDQSQGVVITKIVEDTGAEKAGLKRGDIILKVNDESIKDFQELRRKIASYKPGEKIKMSVVQDGKKKDVNIELSEFPEESAVASNSSSEKSRESDELFKGVKVKEIDKQIRGQLQAPDDVGGVVVMEIDAASDAYDAGLRRGHIIQEIGSTEVSNTKEAFSAVKNLSGSKARILVWGGGAFRYLIVPVK